MSFIAQIQNEEDKMKLRDIKTGMIVKVVPFQRHQFSKKPSRLGTAKVIDKDQFGVTVRFDDGFEEFVDSNQVEFVDINLGENKRAESRIKSQVKNLFENDDVSDKKSDKDAEDLELLLDDTKDKIATVNALADSYFEDALVYKSEMDIQVEEEEALTVEELIEKSDHWAPDYMSEIEDLKDQGFNEDDARDIIETAMRNAEEKLRKELNQQLREGDSSVEEDDLFDKCQKSCDDSYEKCDASCEGDTKCEDDCADIYNQCGANCEDLDNIDEAVEKALREQSNDYDTIPIDDVRKEAIRSILYMCNHTNEWSVRDTLIKFTEWGFYKGRSMVIINEKVAKDICKQLIRFLKNEAQKKDIWDVYDIVSHYASDEQRSEWSKEALREQSDDVDDKILFWVNSEKLDELLHKHFSPDYEGDYYVLSNLDWQKFQDVASSNGFDKEEDYDEAYDLSGKFIAEAKDPKAPRVMNIKWKRGGVLGPRASKIPEDIFKEFLDQGRDDSVILSWLSRKFRGIPVSFEWTTFKGSPIREWKDSGEPDINDVDDEETVRREDDDSKMEHDEDKDKEYYIELDDETGLWCVFNGKKPNHAYASYSEKDEAEREAMERNKMYAMNESKKLKNEVKKLFEDKDSENEKKDPKKYPFSLQVMHNHKWIDHLYFKTEEEANKKRDEYIEDPRGEPDPERYRVKERATIKEDVEVNIPQRGDFAIAELSPQEKQEVVWTFAGECADVIEKMIESNVSIRGVYGYEVPRKAEVMHAKLFDFILAEIERA